jgi:hypothetical protein
VFYHYTILSVVIERRWKVNIMLPCIRVLPHPHPLPFRFRDKITLPWILFEAMVSRKSRWASGFFYVY